MIEKNYSAIDSGVTNIFEALENIYECACCEGRWAITHDDIKVMVGSLYAIASKYYTELPRDVNGDPISIGDKVKEFGDNNHHVVCGFGKNIEGRFFLFVESSESKDVCIYSDKVILVHDDISREDVHDILVDLIDDIEKDVKNKEKKIYRYVDKIMKLK